MTDAMRVKQAYAPEGVYAGMTQAEALRYLAKRYLRKPECVALCNEVANNLSKLLEVVEAAQALQVIDAVIESRLSDELEDIERYVNDQEDAENALRKALEELNND